MHFTDMVFFWAKSDPERAALIQPDMIVTYRELAEAIEAISERIVQYDFDTREPVAVSIHRPIQMLAVCLALLRSGISIAPINRAALPHLRGNGIHNVVYTGEGLMLSGGRNIRFEETWFKRGTQARAINRSSRPNAADADTIFLAPNPSGAPRKMVVPTGAYMTIFKMLPLTGEANFNRTLTVAGVNTPLGFSRAVSNLYAGKTACFAADCEAQLVLIGMFNIETLSCSAQQASELVNFIKKNGKYPLESLRQIWIDRGYFKNDLIADIQVHLCRDVVVCYSSDEVGRIAYADYDRIADVPNAVGFVAPGVRVEIVDNDDVPLAPGEYGRVRFYSEYAKIFAANNTKRATERARDDDDMWFYPGDRGSMTKDGILCISEVGRNSRL